ncbi:MAG: hypothetical protein ACXV3D_07960 [Halobacteriota archaeon]
MAIAYILARHLRKMLSTKMSDGDSRATHAFAAREWTKITSDGPTAVVGQRQVGLREFVDVTGVRHETRI